MKVAVANSKSLTAEVRLANEFIPYGQRVLLVDVPSSNDMLGLIAELFAAM